MRERPPRDRDGQSELRYDLLPQLPADGHDRRGQRRRRRREVLRRLRRLVPAYELSSQLDATWTGARRTIPRGAVLSSGPYRSKDVTGCQATSSSPCVTYRYAPTQT